jgi:hypothetical protein
MKMALDAPTIHSTKSNLYLLTNVETLLGFNAMMPLLEVIKFAQLKDVFVCDFIAIKKICEKDMYHVFSDRLSFFEYNVFINFTTFINIIHENIGLHWIINLNTKIDHMDFEFVG